jgi:dihydrofolate synthase / folylpolyglutamate synthase
MLNYQTAVERLYALGHELAAAPGHKFDLAHMRALAKALGHPERRYASVLIAGTNGKGSTAATLASILTAASHRTGLYTSPHLVRVNERIRIGDEAISDAEFTEVYSRVDDAARRLVAAAALPWHPSFFEMLTAMAFEYFAAAGVEIAVLEVGMGGRLDATNIVEPCVAVITDIALDHQKFLGNTIAEIAAEKAGVIHPRGIVVTLPQHPQGNDVLGHAIEERTARAISAAQYVPPISPGAPPVWGQNQKLETGGASPETGNQKLETAFYNCYPLTVLDQQIVVQSPLIGRHQLRNVALAIAAAVEVNQCGFRVTARDIERGVRETRWPGRFQVISGKPTIVLDVAHNPAGAWALRSALSERFEGRPLCFVFGAMRDKAIAEMAEILFPLAERVIATQAANPRSASPEQVRDAIAHTGAEIELAPDVRSAVTRARAVASPGAVIVITGSIFVVGEALQALESG